MDDLPITVDVDPSPTPSAEPPQKPGVRVVCAILIAAMVFFLFGVGSGYWIVRQQQAQEAAKLEAKARQERTDMDSLHEHLNPPGGIKLPVRYGDIGPRLIEAGVIDQDQFIGIYASSGQPLDEVQQAILLEGSQEPVTFTKENAHFLLNLFWAAGLANQNPILDSGPMISESGGDFTGFASTGGWTIGKKPVQELYSSLELVSLSEEQQALLEEVTRAVYRPCCDNPTHFPDCNHGMAMLGLLELAAGQGADRDTLFRIARTANAYWFGQEMMEVGHYLMTAEGRLFSTTPAEETVNQARFSASGFSQVHSWLAQHGALPSDQGGGGGCGL